MATKLITSLVLGLAALQTAHATPAPEVEAKTYPEVVPGPGLPSLAELGLTSAQLYEMPVDHSILDGYPAVRVRNIMEKRYEPRCGPSDAAYANVNDLIACFNYLRNLGGTRCEAPANYGVVEMCYSGSGHVIGQSITGRSSSSSCADVASAVLWSIDHCTRPDQSCAGFNAAYGNGDLIIGAVNRRW